MSGSTTISSTGTTTINSSGTYTVSASGVYGIVAYGSSGVGTAIATLNGVSYGLSDLLSHHSLLTP